VLPAGLGLLLGAAGPRLLAPSPLALGLAMSGPYAFIRPPSRPSSRLA
jgi:hypothetical protein